MFKKSSIMIASAFVFVAIAGVIVFASLNPQGKDGFYTASDAGYQFHLNETLQMIDRALDEDNPVRVALILPLLLKTNPHFEDGTFSTFDEKEAGKFLTDMVNNFSYGIIKSVEVRHIYMQNHNNVDGVFINDGSLPQTYHGLPLQDMTLDMFWGLMVVCDVVPGRHYHIIFHPNN